MSSKKGLKISYEFFPPRNVEMERRLWRSIGQLERLNPAFFSMTYGALGSTQSISIDTAIAMHGESSAPVAAHLTCVDATRAEILGVAETFHRAGITRIVALRGDSAQQEKTSAGTDTLDSAVDLINGLSEIANFDISVAAYPEVHPKARSAASDLKNLKNKLEAGANRAITQYFFEADSYLRFRDQATKLGIDKPIVPGILPIHDFTKVCNFSQRCGAVLPDSYADLYDRVKDDARGQYQLSLELATRLCERLRSEGAEQLHLYTLNQTDMCLDISLALGASVNPLNSSNAA